VDAILNVWKPVGWTSFDVVKKIRRHVRPSKVGHAGTLDPFAEGVLVICIGKMTKQVESLMDHEKEYIATIQLGRETDTLDTEGRTVKEEKIPPFSPEGIAVILDEFLGESTQIPPMYSALKFKGKRLYELARQGKVVERKPRKITISEIELLESDRDSLKIRVKCGRGTYIRVLASDIAARINTVGFLKSLVRTEVGKFNEKDSMSIEDTVEWLSVTA